MRTDKKKKKGETKKQLGDNYQGERGKEGGNRGRGEIIIKEKEKEEGESMR